MELGPEVKALTVERYMLLGALVMINTEAKDQSWRELYQERLAEIEAQLNLTGDTDAHDRATN